MNIQTYGISITTLEEVFLRVAHLKEERKEEARRKKREEEKKRLDHESNIDKSLVKDQSQEDSNMIDDVDNFDLNKVRITNKS